MMWRLQRWLLLQRQAMAAVDRQLGIQDGPKLQEQMISCRLAEVVGLLLLLVVHHPLHAVDQPSPGLLDGH